MAMTESAARAADAALRAKADELEKLARTMDDSRAKPEGYHPNTIEWFATTAPALRADADALRTMGRALLKEALS